MEGWGQHCVEVQENSLSEILRLESRSLFCHARNSPYILYGFPLHLSFNIEIKMANLKKDIIAASVLSGKLYEN